MIDAFLSSLGIPEACLLDKPVYKKMFLDHAELDQTDRKALSEDVGRIRWQYTLKPDTINIAPFQDSEREYLEIAVLSVELSNPARLNRVAAFMHRAIPYPLILAFEHAGKIAISVAEKRINQADKSKLVLVDRWQTEWIDPNKPSTSQAAFLEAIQLHRLPATNFYALYEAFQSQVIGLITSDRTGTFVSASISASKEHTVILGEIHKLEREIAELRTTLNREHQMGSKITLNSMIRERKDAILKLEARLNFSN
ncbi:MAG: hypothetical protein RLZZ360_374 [Candidatus Parcubacteria bacterium]|jgi:hypothetical protein